VTTPKVSISHAVTWREIDRYTVVFLAAVGAQCKFIVSDKYQVQIPPNLSTPGSAPDYHMGWRLHFILSLYGAKYSVLSV